MNTSKLLPWLVGGGAAVLVLCCGGGGITGLLWWGLQPAATTSRLAGAKVPEPEPTVPRQRAKDADQEDFAQFVAENAQDSSELAILSWGKKESRGAAILREARFRCKLIAFTPGGEFSPGVHERGGEPVSLDDAQIYYTPDGKIQRVHLDKCRTFWNAKSR